VAVRAGGAAVGVEREPGDAAEGREGEGMRIAVLTLTRDRLPYTQHCFQTLSENAGCDYDHYVLDQGSEDGTMEWLLGEESVTEAWSIWPNIGINLGMNFLLDMLYLDEYDVVVKFDNDCELLTPKTLRTVCYLAGEQDMILSPCIHGLRNPVPRISHTRDIDVAPIVGGIFMAVPAYVYRQGFRYGPGPGLWGSDDSDLCAWWQQQGKQVGYARGYHANHYLTTDGQHADIPHYFARTLAEGKPSIL
jgi:hypothetical protein